MRFIPALFLAFFHLAVVSCGEATLRDTDTGTDSDTTVNEVPADFAPTDTDSFTPPPPPIAPVANKNSKLTAVWANEGGDKVVQEDLRASEGEDIRNSAFDGTRVKLFGAKNEVVSLNLVLEAAQSNATNVSVSFSGLKNDAGFEIKTDPSNTDPFNYVGRNIELFYVRYLQIKGKSAFMCLNYDERHLPRRFRRSHTDADGNVLSGGWKDRPDHDTHYPEIAVPLSLHPSFEIAAGKNQSIWVDVYLPKDAPAGVYHGEIEIREGLELTWKIPVDLNVFNFTLPDEPTAKTMISLGYGDLNKRYLGYPFPDDNTPGFELAKLVRNRHFQMAHRHKLSLIDGNSGAMAGEDPDIPNAQWRDRLNGKLFTAQNGYDGPGLSVGNNVFSVGTYGTWSFKDGPDALFWSRSDFIVNWFSANAPTTEYFVYLIDESSDFPLIEGWASLIQRNPGVGKNLKTLATLWLPEAHTRTPSLDIPTSGMYVGDTEELDNALKAYQNDPGKRFYMYNSGRPAVGSFMTDDDGVALRVIPWAQFKKGVHRWFYWESTYYNNFQHGAGETDVFRTAKTFGTTSGIDPALGENGALYSNGDGVLFYPGTDKIFPSSSYGVSGPIASLRLKHWRRGVQDTDYLKLAMQKNPARTQAVINKTVPKVLWEYGIDDPNDPTYVRTPISWSDNPNDWEKSRWELAEIILGK